MLCLHVPRQVTEPPPARIPKEPRPPRPPHPGPPSAPTDRADRADREVWSTVSLPLTAPGGRPRTRPFPLPPVTLGRAPQVSTLRLERGSLPSSPPLCHRRLAGIPSQRSPPHTPPGGLPGGDTVSLEVQGPSGHVQGQRPARTGPSLGLDALSCHPSRCRVPVSSSHGSFLAFSCFSV